MGEVTEGQANDMGDEDGLIHQVESYEDDQPSFPLSEPESDAAKPEEKEPVAEPAKAEPTKPEPTEEPTVEIDGEQVPVSKIKEWKSGSMMQADYQRKTADMAATKRRLEAVYGSLEEENTGGFDVSTPPPEVTDPYDSAQVVDHLEHKMERIFAKRDKRDAYKSRQVSFNNVRSENWGKLQSQYPDLQDPNSNLYKVADQVMNVDPGLLNSPLCDTYAVTQALQILGPAYEAEAKAAGAAELVTKLGETTKPAQRPGGGGKTEGGDSFDEALTAEEQRFAKMSPERGATLTEAQFNKMIKAKEKVARLQREGGI